MVSITVVIPTRDRPAALIETLRRLSQQTLPATDYEVIVVDDGSVKPVTIAPGVAMSCRVLRLDGRERSAARNEGARHARGEVVAFVDDDISVEPTFLEAHLRAHAEWPDALVVGGIQLPDDTAASPFGRFRRAFEAHGVPTTRGRVATPNFCAAGNMSIRLARFFDLGGFDETIASGEDQDLALRHTARGAAIVFLPEARSVHRDSALDLQSYSRRVERGSEAIVAFCRRHPEWPDNVERARVNGPIRWSVDSLATVVRKLGKQLIASTPAFRVLFATAAVLECTAPRSPHLDRLYRLVLGVSILRGYRRGIARAVAAGSPASGDCTVPEI